MKFKTLKELQGESCWLGNTRKQPSGWSQTRWCNHISNPAWSWLGMEPTELSEFD